MVGVPNLFSQDFYELVKKRLKPGGIFAQWMQLYYLDGPSVALVLRTVLSSFSKVQLWFTDVGDVVLLASDVEMDISLDRVRSAYTKDPRIAYHMNAYGPGESPDWFYGCFLLDRAAIQELADRFDKTVMTDDRPVLEYWALRSLFRKSYRHMEQIWKAKMDLAQVFPPTRAKVPPEGAILAGGISMLRSLPNLRARVSRWAMQRREEAPEVRLMRAKALGGVGQRIAAGKLTTKLKGDPLVGKDAVLLQARLLLKSGMAKAALKELDGLGTHRPVAKHWFRYQALIQMGDYSEAWEEANALLNRVRTTKDADAHRIQWSRFYRFLSRVASGARNHEAVIALLSRKPPMYGGELFRLYTLLDAYRGLEKHHEAGKVMDQIMSYGLIDHAQLRTCEKVYRQLGQKEKADDCHIQSLKLRLLPSDRPLWE